MTEQELLQIPEGHIYTMTKIPFDRWMEHNRNVEHLVITGITDMAAFEAFAASFDYTKFKRITLAGVDIEEASDNDSLAEHCSFSYENEITAHMYSFDENIVYPLTKMYLNSDKGHGKFVVVDGEILSIDKKTLIHTPEREEIIIQEGIAKIGKFVCCDYQTTIRLKLNDGLQEIGDHAFAYSPIGELYMPDSLTTLGEAAFYSTDMEKVRFSENLQNIPDDCFAYTLLQEIKLPCSVRSIGCEAFARTQIDCVIIPEGVESIEWNAFDFLIHIYLPPTLRNIAPDFYYETGIDDGICPPYVRVHPDNPIFYAKEGTLYFRSNDECALDAVYNGIRDYEE